MSRSSVPSLAHTGTRDARGNHDIATRQDSIPDSDETAADQLNLQEEGRIRPLDRFIRKEIGVLASLKVIGLSSWLNVLLVVVPWAWVAMFLHWSPLVVFTLSFIAIIPLERLIYYGGDQMSYYLGKDLGDLIIITLNNSVEATLATILLYKCELQLLKATIVGVVIRHLLLVPGTAFAMGGARIIHQDLHPHHPQATGLNHSLLSLGVLSLLLPAAFFAALDTGFAPPGTTESSSISDETREIMLEIGRGIAVLLLIAYFCSRIYIHNPPGKSDEHTKQVSAPPMHSQKGPEVNQWVCLVMLIICIGIMAATAAMLVEGIEFVRETGHIEEEWFGLILLPIVSFAAEGTLAVTYFFHYMFRHIFREPAPPSTLATAEGIDLSIQFLLFWMPFFILLAWWTNKPFSLLFDIYEVAAIIGSCFIVNYVTADAKTNWAEGVTMIVFYVMIALCVWFYPGQPELRYFSQCESVALALTLPAATAE